MPTRFATLNQLRKEHEASVKLFASHQSRSFAVRVRFLAREIQKEIPQITGVQITRAGLSFWPSDVKIPWQNIKTKQEFTWELSKLTAFIIDLDNFHDERPKVSPLCLQYITELYSFSMYLSSGCVMHTLIEFNVHI